MCSKIEPKELRIPTSNFQNAGGPMVQINYYFLFSCAYSYHCRGEFLAGNELQVQVSM